MKKKLICAIGIAAVGALLIVGIPAAINEAYKTGTGYVTLWDAKDVLSYYGTILGSLVTIAGLAITISFTKRQIQRESYLKSESDRWVKIETVVSNILDEINPITILEQVMDAGFAEPAKAINLLQKYQMSCRSATDQLCAYLNNADYTRVKDLVDHIAAVAEKFFQASQKGVNQYSRIQQLQLRNTVLKLLSMAEQHPDMFSAEEFAKYQVTIQTSDDIRFEDIESAIRQLNEEIIRIYETDFRGLLQLKGTTFETIGMQMQKNADAILSLWRK